MIHFCRHILAAIHFNYNLRRETKRRADGRERVKVTFPKFKNGEATVRDVRVTQNFGKSFDVYIQTPKALRVETE